MNYKKELSSIVLASVTVVLFLILILSAASAAEQSAEQSALPAIIESRITSTESAEDPDIYGNRIVYIDTRNGNYDLYMYDLSTSKETQITTNGSAEDPNIYGDTIVWQDMRNGNYDIYIYDLSTKKETHTFNESYQYYPDIYGNIVVWADGRNGGHDIYMQDLSTKKQTRVTTSGTAYYPKIYGNRIVWIDERNGSSDGVGDIYMYDLSAHQETRITTSGTANYPNIYGNRIVWNEYRNNSDNVYIYDLSTQKETEIITDGGRLRSNAIYGDKIVWAEGCPPDFGDCQLYALYMYDLSTSRKTQITTNESPKSDVAMYGNRIVWADYRNNVNNPYGDIYSNPDIYMVTLGTNLPIAAFSASPTSGSAPLNVAFTDTSTGSPTSWNWSFGDGATSKEQNPKYTYPSTGNYTVELTVANGAGMDTETRTGYISVKSVSSKLVAAFSGSPTSGNASLHVAFTDTSTGSPASWNWSFGDGATSTERNPTHIYSAAGTYIVTLTVSNGNETASNTSTINVLQESSSSGNSDNGGGNSDESSSGGSSNGGSINSGSSHSSGGGGGGGGGSPEPQSNVEIKELSQTFVTSGKSVKFDFPRNATPVVYVSFNAKKTLGKTTTIAELLKGKSALVSELPAGEVYKSFSVWVGNGGIASSKNIENPVLCFKVEKFWLQNKSIDPASIALNRYSDKKWELLPVKMSGEDSKYLYFTVNVSGFSSFAITGKAKSTSEQQEASENQKVSEQSGENLPSIGSVKLTDDPNDTVIKGGTEKKTPGFEMILGIVCLLGVFLYKRK